MDLRRLEPPDPVRLWRILIVPKMSASVSKQKQFRDPMIFAVTFAGGPEEIRTLDLIIANDALYQLSYRPSQTYGIS